MQANQTAVAAILKQYGANSERISYVGPEPGKCESPPCEAKCIDDRSSLALGASKWGCYQNNFFMGAQPIIEPAPPKTSQGLGVIQGDTVT